MRKNTGKKPLPDMFQHFVNTVAGKDGGYAYINAENVLITMPAGLGSMADDEHKTPIRSFQEFFNARNRIKNWNSLYDHMTNIQAPIDIAPRISPN